MMCRLFLIIIVATAMGTACNHYDYPASTPASSAAAALNQNLVSSYGTVTGNSSSHVSIQDMQCRGEDYVVTVHVGHNFEGVQYLALQYQVVYELSNGLPTFTQPMDTLVLDIAKSQADVVLTIPGANVLKPNSDILVRLKLKTRDVIEHTSAVESIHVTNACHAS